MKPMHALAVVALAALAAPVFAQVSSGTGLAVTSGTGPTVHSATAPDAAVVAPSSAVMIEAQPHLLPGGVMAPVANTVVMGGPPAAASGSRTIITRYWVNVPANVEQRADFQRWKELR